MHLLGPSFYQNDYKTAKNNTHARLGTKQPSTAKMKCGMQEKGLCPFLHPARGKTMSVCDD